MSDSVRHHTWQPTRLSYPWDSPGKNTGVGCHFLLQCVKVKSLSRVRLLATPWTAAYQAPPSMGFSRQKYWSGVPLPSPIYLPTYLYLFLTTISTICTHPLIYTLPYFLLVSPNYPGILPVLLHAVLLFTSTDNSTCIIAALELSSSIVIIQLFIDCYPCRLLSVPMNKLVSQLQHLLSLWL